MILVAFLLMLTVLASSGGHLCVSRAMKGVGEVKDLSPLGLAAMVGAAFHHPFFWLGIGVNTLAFFSKLALLSLKELSFVVPATALSYVIGTLGARFFLGEQVSTLRWAGVLLVGLGVTLIVLG